MAKKEPINFDLPKYIAVVVSIVWALTIIAQLIFTASGIDYSVDTEVHAIMGAVVGALWAFKDIKGVISNDKK